MHRKLSLKQSFGFALYVTLRKELGTAERIEKSGGHVLKTCA